jgi:acetyl-CoA acyltransferase
MNAYLIDGYRTAVGKAPRGLFRFMRPDDLAAVVIKHLVSKFPQLDPSTIDDLIVGNAVPEAEQGMQMGRMISLLSLPIQVPGMIVNRYCGSGLEAIAIASARIHAGQADIIIAGGTESMSMVPTAGWKTALNYKIAKEHSDYYLGMGLTAEMVQKRYDISRQDQDLFAFHSHQCFGPPRIAAAVFDRCTLQYRDFQTIFCSRNRSRQSCDSAADNDQIKIVFHGVPHVLMAKGSLAIFE